jgi:methylmalonyl-CoA mutase cobalamin-binding domain/chain
MSLFAFRLVRLRAFSGGVGMNRDNRPSKPIRMLMAKPGLDGHDRGVKVLALALRDAGFEILYTGLHRTCEEIVTIAIQEDVDVIGVSMLSGGQYAILSRIMELLRAQAADDIMVVAGGFLPDQDEIRAIKQLGVREVFDTDTRMDAVATFLREAVAQKCAAAAVSGSSGASGQPGK